MPTTAQDRVRRGPFGALLILLSLLLSSGTAASAGAGPGGSLPRLGPSRSGAATAILPAGTRNPLDDEASDFGSGPALPPSAPSLVTERLWTRPPAEANAAYPAELSRPAYASYRARAPPAF